MTGIYSHQEDNGTQETLFTQDHPISNATAFKDRVKLGADYGLSLSPVQIHDDDRKFSCHVTVRRGTILRSSTRVKVFGKSFCSLDSLTSCHPAIPIACFAFPLERKQPVTWSAAKQGWLFRRSFIYLDTYLSYKK